MVDADQLFDRGVVIIHPHVEEHPFRVVRILAHDLESGRLHAPDVAARFLPCGQRRQQSLGEGARGRRVSLGHRFNDLLAGENVALTGPAFGGQPAGPVEAVGACVCSRAALRIHNAELPDLAALVALQQLLDHFGRVAAFPEQRQPPGAQVQVGVGLRGNGADTGQEPWDNAADGERLGLDDDPQLVRGGIVGNEGEGHAGVPPSRSGTFRCGG
jgi:hypothetical protein